MTTQPPVRQRCDRPKNRSPEWGYRPGALCVVMRSRSRHPVKGSGERVTIRLDLVAETGHNLTEGHYIAAVASGVRLHQGNGYSDSLSQPRPVNRSIAIVGRPKVLRARDLWADHRATVWHDISALVKVVERYLEDAP